MEICIYGKIYIYTYVCTCIWKYWNRWKSPTSKILKLLQHAKHCALLRRLR